MFLASPALVIFVSSNFVNVGNLAFNMLFSRWMGPELFGDLALVLTIKLAILGITGAIQMAVSQHVAGEKGAAAHSLLASFARANHRIFVVLWLLLPIAFGIVVLGAIHSQIGIDSPSSLLLLLLAFPFTIPLAILRGVAFGRLAVGPIVLSANMEMGVRLLGGAVAWHLGFGIEGVVFAISLSIVCAWACLAPLLPSGPQHKTADFRPAKRAALASLPFAILQLSQVIALDGDIFLAGAFLPPEQAGFIAALSLFQRIAFFACFALASVLLPSVVSAIKEGEPLFLRIRPVSLLFLAVAIPFLVSTRLIPETLLSLLVGPAFVSAAIGLWPAAIAAVAFTFGFLLATFLAALGDTRGIWITSTIALAQLLGMYILVQAPDADFSTLVQLKANVQACLAAILAVYTIFRAGKSRRF